MKKISTLVCAMLTMCAAHSVNAEMFEYPSATSLPYDDIRIFQRDPSLLTGFDLNLSAERFANAWFSKTNERERIKADMYFLGVMNATEGKAWCSYKRLLPFSAHEHLYSRFENLKPEERNIRASTLIVESLADVLPCKTEKK